MMSINYSKLFTHKVEHQDFITTWIIEHIKTRDMLLAKEYQLKIQSESN